MNRLLELLMSLFTKKQPEPVAASVVSTPNPAAPPVVVPPTLPGIQVPPDFNRNSILSDASFKWNSGLSSTAFLASHYSCLATYVVEGVPAGDFIDAVCKQHGVPQEFILTRLQCEQGLVTAKVLPSKMVLERCLGFGMTDSGDVVKYYGFANQITSAVVRIAQLYGDAANKIGRPFVVDRDKDGSFEVVVPQTRFTYALYVYTPWIGYKPHITVLGYKVGHDGYAYGALDTWKFTKKKFPYMLA